MAKQGRTLQQIANAVARAAGYGTATHIEFGDVAEPVVTRHQRYGYRKYSDGQYVPNKYRSNFGWKNTYYQPAETTVTFPFAYALMLV